MTRQLGQRALSVALFGLGIAALAITVQMTMKFGSTLAVTDEGQALQQASSAVVDGFTALLALAVGVLWRRGRRAFAAMVAVVTLGFGAYSMSSVVGFGIFERVGKATVAELQQEAEIDAVREANAQAAQMRQQTLGWLQSTLVATKRTGDRALLIDAIKSTAAAPVHVAAPKISVSSGDLQAAVYARYLFGGNSQQHVEHLQVAMIAALSALLIFGKVIGLALSAALWPSSSSTEKRGAASASGHGPAVPAEERETPKEAPAPLPVPVRPIDAAPQPLKPGGKPAVEAFVNQARTAAVRKDVRVKSETAYLWYRAFAAARGEAALSHAAFGRIIGELIGADRLHDGRFVVYRGLGNPNAPLKVAAVAA